MRRQYANDLGLLVSRVRCSTSTASRCVHGEMHWYRAVVIRTSCVRSVIEQHTNRSRAAGAHCAMQRSHPHCVGRVDVGAPSEQAHHRLRLCDGIPAFRAWCPRGRVMQRRRTTTVFCVDVCAKREQHRHDIGAICGGGNVQGRITRIDVSPDAFEEVRRRDLTCPSSSRS